MSLHWPLGATSLVPIAVSGRRLLLPGEVDREFERHEEEEGPLGRLLRALLTIAFRVGWEIWWRLPGRVRLTLRPYISRLVPAGPFAPATGGTPFVASRSASGLPPLPARVSVVIPTRDAGPGFARTLDALDRQEGVREIELIVVDSGSRDGTREHARRHGARVVEIAPEEFNHGATRELAAGLAAGDTLLMTVQDAVLVGRYALRRLCEDLEADDRCAAVSARQVPHSGSDIFAAYAVWFHTRAMENARRLPNGDTPPARRARAQIDDVCALIRREAWQEIHFRPVPFAEDLDFGLRAVEAGWTIGASTAAVVHAHVRPAAYHLQRMAVDTFRIGSMLDLGAGRHADRDVGSVAADALALLGELQAAFAHAEGNGGGIELAGWLADVGVRLRGAPEPEEPGASLAPLAAMLQPLAGPAAPASRRLRHDLAVQLERGGPHAFAGAFHDVTRGEGEEFVAKVAAAAVGGALGGALRREPAGSGALEHLAAGI